MDHRLPEPLKALVEQLARLPGLGPKSAMRVAMTLLKWPEAETRRLGKGIHDLRDNLRLCSRCGALTETDPCNVCSDKERDDSLLCVVAEWDSMLTLEEGAFYKGRYLILGGLLAPLDNLSAESLELDRLTKRLEEGQVREVVLALGVVIFTGLTAYDTQKIRAFGENAPLDDATAIRRGALLGALTLYLDFINLFLMLLRLMGDRR